MENIRVSLLAAVQVSHSKFLMAAVFLFGRGY